MSQTDLADPDVVAESDLADPDVVAESDQEVIDVPDDSASQSAGNSKRRPASDAWNNFKRIPNPNPGNSKRKYLGVCRLWTKSHCKTRRSPQTCIKLHKEQQRNEVGLSSATDQSRGGRR